MLYLPGLDELGATNSPPVLRVKRDVHQKLNVPLVELTLDIQPQGKALYLEADPVHFNARGNQIIARRLLETVTNLANP